MHRTSFPESFLLRQLVATVAAAGFVAAAAPARSGEPTGPLSRAVLSISVEVRGSSEVDLYSRSVVTNISVSEGIEVPSMREIRGAVNENGYGVADVAIDIEAASITIAFLGGESFRFGPADFSGYIFRFPDVPPARLAGARLHFTQRLAEMENNAVSVRDDEIRVNVAGLPVEPNDVIRIDFPIAPPLTSSVTGIGP